MADRAPRVYTDPADIDRLKRLQLELDGELQVELRLRDGTVLRGTVPERPTLQQFLDAEGNEGTNGVFRLDHGERDGAVRLFWLDEVDGFTRLGSS